MRGYFPDKSRNVFVSVWLRFFRVCVCVYMCDNAFFDINIQEAGCG